jgi:hypothetical protein
MGKHSGVVCMLLVMMPMFSDGLVGAVGTGSGRVGAWRVQKIGNEREG